MTTYRWHAHGVTPGGVHIVSAGVTVSEWDPHTIAESRDWSLRNQHPEVVWRDFTGRPERPGDRCMPILRIINP